MSENNGKTRRNLSISIPTPGSVTASSAAGLPAAVSNPSTIDNDVSKESEEPLTARTVENPSSAPVSSPNTVISGVSSPSTAPATPNPMYSQNSSSQNVAGPSVINKQLLSKLNKSMKEKQKVLGQKDAHKNLALLQDILITSPQLNAFPASISGGANITNEAPTAPADTTEGEDNDNSVSNTASTLEVASKTKAKSKRIAKQNSTRTDFFAAKLASAVDDVETSDSDETFVYENNANNFEETGNNETNETRSIVGTSESINQVPPSIHLVNDNILTAGSIKNATPLESMVSSPLAEVHKERDDEHGAESVHSIQSSKWNLRNTVGANITPPTTMNVRAPLQLAASGNLLSIQLAGQSSADDNSYTNPYMENSTKDANYKARRRSSSHSLLNYDTGSRPLNRSPMLFAESQNLGAQVPSSFGMSIALPPSISESNDGRYSFEDDDLMADDASLQDINLVYTDNNANNTITVAQDALKGDETFPSKTTTKKKLSTSSSKLRSTTSKLFDKKGAQPRRYSIIPDDIDIEDFDDELIYYDNNNMRFPYNSQNGQISETASLLGNNNPRIQHYRSLNFQGKRQPSYMKNKRYSSLGYPPTSPVQPTGKTGDIFPFPYPEPNLNYYYDFDEYDEDAHMDGGEELRQKGLFPGRSHLSPSNTHFFLPRKVSDDSIGYNKFKCFKSFVWTLVSILLILTVGFILGFLLASTKDLSNISIVSIENALVSQDELVFSIVVEALNPGWFTVTVEDLQLDIFAKTGYLQNGISQSSVETVLLGTVFLFESALSFEGSFFNRELIQQKGEIKLIGPGKNFTGSRERVSAAGRAYRFDEDIDPPDNSEKWAIISKHPFDLILRGVLKYNLPLTSNVKSAVINKVRYVDPDHPDNYYG